MMPANFVSAICVSACVTLVLKVVRHSALLHVVCSSRVIYYVCCDGCTLLYIISNGTPAFIKLYFQWILHIVHYISAAAARTAEFKCSW